VNLEHCAAISVPTINSTVTIKAVIQATVGVGCISVKKTLLAFVMTIFVLNY
jgi:hypothetical protein